MLFQNRRPVEWLVVGLGNPGDQYANTRHNVGFQVVDELARRAGVAVRRARFHALTGTATLGGTGVLLIKPTTYMNLSGQSVGEAARFYRLPSQRVLVLSDDTALPLGKLRIRASGSAGGHNGLKNIIQHLGGENFPRLKVGVGSKPHPDYDMAHWVLGQVTGPARAVLDEAVQRAADAVECLLSEGMDRAMNRFH